MIVMHIKEIDGDCKIPGYEKWITVDSFDFGTERSVEKAGKGGSNDIDTGKGDAQEFSIDKSSDVSTVALMYAAIRHRGSADANTPFQVDIAFLEPRFVGDQDSKGSIKAYMKLRFGKALLKSWRLSGAANSRGKESLTFWYNQVAIMYDAVGPDGKAYQQYGPRGWDQLEGKDWRPSGW